MWYGAAEKTIDSDIFRHFVPLDVLMFRKDAEIFTAHKYVLVKLMV